MAHAGRAIGAESIPQKTQQGVVTPEKTGNFQEFPIHRPDDTPCSESGKYPDQSAVSYRRWNPPPDHRRREPSHNKFPRWMRAKISMHLPNPREFVKESFSAFLPL
jgi:hypothetical protein